MELSKDKNPDKIVYYHNHHSNSCVVGEICISSARGSEFIAITHNIVYEDYGDNLCDITKIWDANVKIEVVGFHRYDTDYDSCIHIPLDIGEHTALANQVLKQILLDNNIEIVKLPDLANQFSLEEFFRCIEV